MNSIPFNKPFIPEEAFHYISHCLNNSVLENGHFTKLATQELLKLTKTKTVLLTTSCTAALEIAALLIDIQPGDEVIMPSYTFVSTANAFVLRGAVPVFIDIRPDTLNIDEALIEAAITPKTKAIIPMHYAGISCEMNAIQKLAEKYQLYIIEDAAQGIYCSYRNQPLGTLGHMASFSFHHTKNITAGFGGALLINDEKLVDRAKILWQKGTNREAFVAGVVDKYTWVDLGSAYLLNEINAALLCSQLERGQQITERRIHIWNQYHQFLNQPQLRNKVFSLPSLPEYATHNGHLYYLILKTPEQRTEFIKNMKQNDVEASFHYIPLHSSPAGKKFGKTQGTLKWTDHHSQRLVRLPLYPLLTDDQVTQILNCVSHYL